MQQPTHEQICFILESAILAPSADNHHRVRFEIIGDTIRVRHVGGELPLPGGYKRVLVLLSLGALVENLTIGASRFGIAVEADLLPQREQPEVVLQVRLRPHGAEVDPLWAIIPRRHTSRQMVFSGPVMSDAHYGELEAAVRACSGSELVWLEKVKWRTEALRLMRRAETERFRNRLLHEELFSAIRFDVGWHSTSSEGLPPGSLGVEAPLRMFFAGLRHWSLARWVNVFGAHHMLGFRSCYLPCQIAPHVGLLTTRKADDRSTLDTGRSFQRLWLVATAHGRVLQPMPASALYACTGAIDDGIPEGLQRCLAERWQRILGDSIPLMLFRLGFAAQAPIVSGRRPLNDYLDGSITASP